MTTKKIKRLRAALLAAKIDHYSCEDGYYSCPKSVDGSLDDNKMPNICDCGADTHNAKIDEALAATEDK